MPQPSSVLPGGGYAISFDMRVATRLFTDLGDLPFALLRLEHRPWNAHRPHHRRVLQEGQRLCRPGSRARGEASIITEVLDDPARAAAVGQAGRAAAVKLSGERNARLTCGVYGKALAAAS